MFIELTSVSENKVLINLRTVTAVTDHETYTVIHYDGDEFEAVEEQYDKVKDLIKNEVAAERGF